MKTKETGGFFWPPRGWKQLGNISKPEGQALAKDIRTARIHGLSYRIGTAAVHDGAQTVHRYAMTIEAWEYSILNESYEYPILSFDLMDRLDLLTPREHYVTDIKVMARPVQASRLASRRAVTAAIFLIRQIELGIVPDVERVLGIYRLREEDEPALFRMTPFRSVQAEPLSKSWKS